MVAVVVTTTSSALTKNISRNIKMIANTFGDDDHCMSASMNFLTRTLSTIIVCLNEGLDENMSSINRHLTLLNLCRLPANPTCYHQCSRMSRSLATACRECKLCQYFHHSKQKKYRLAHQGLTSHLTRLYHSTSKPYSK